jgi:hypothetical protein
MRWSDYLIHVVLNSLSILSKDSHKNLQIK